VWGRRKLQSGFFCRDVRERDELENSGVEGLIILFCCSRTGMFGMGSINVNQDRESWRAVVIARMNIMVQEMPGNS
jgi:hypothetical protein